MDGSSSGESSRRSTISVVDKGFNLISHNTELLILISVGFVEIFAEAAGYRPFNRFNELLPPLPDLGDNYEENENQLNQTNQVEVTNFTLIHQISKGVDTVGTYTVAISLAAHILLPYPVITERQKMLLVPWLVISLLRSVARELVITLVSIVHCASYDVFYYPCVQYTALQGAQFCFILYFWTSVHSFYHHLDRKTVHNISSVIDTIKRATVVEGAFSPQISRDFSAEMIDDDDLTEVALVERAAMAWIAREILENDDEYVTDNQFSQYLTIKAGMELRQALKELREKKCRMRPTRKKTIKQKVEESLEFMNLSDSLRNTVVRRKSFDRTTSLPKINRLRRNQLISQNESVLTIDGSRIIGLSGLMGPVSTSSIDAESQTEPPTHSIKKILDTLEFQQQKPKKS